MKRSPESPQPDQKSDEAAGGFLSRWSQRKRETDTAEPSISAEVAEQDSQVLEQGTTPDVEADVSAPAATPDVDAEVPVLTDADMPDIETLNADSDFSPFFSEGVSKQLRNLALKKLFFSGKFSARDGLDDYDDDFTYFEPLGDTVTSDMKFHQRRKEKARIAELEAAEAEEKLAEQQAGDAELEADELDDSKAEVETSESDLDTPEEQQPDETDDTDNILHTEVDSDTDVVQSSIEEDAGQPLG